MSSIVKVVILACVAYVICNMIAWGAVVFILDAIARG